jgi:hypothetical protein
MTLETLPPDPALPSLRIAGDRNRMRELFRRHLRPLPGSDWELEDCRLSRIHYHRGDRCALRYTLRLIGRRTGGERSQWVTGLLYAGDRAARVWRKLRAANVERDVPVAFATFEPLSFIPELEMIAQVFPYDRHLPMLSRLATTPPPDLEPVFFAELGPGLHAEVRSVEPIQYRIGRAAVLRYEVEARPGSTAGERKRFYAKVIGGRSRPSGPIGSCGRSGVGPSRERASRCPSRSRTSASSGRSCRKRFPGRRSGSSFSEAGTGRRPGKPLARWPCSQTARSPDSRIIASRAR